MDLKQTIALHRTGWDANASLILVDVSHISAVQHENPTQHALIFANGNTFSVQETYDQIITKILEVGK